jgi:hypothetical protein
MSFILLSINIQATRQKQTIHLLKSQPFVFTAWLCKTQFFGEGNTCNRQWETPKLTIALTTRLSILFNANQNSTHFSIILKASLEQTV